MNWLATINWITALKTKLPKGWDASHPHGCWLEESVKPAWDEVGNCRSIICDIDGTIADNDHRSGFVDRIALAEFGQKPDWKKYNSLMADDTPKHHIISVYHALTVVQGMKGVLLTGREEVYRAVTLTWLEEHSVTHDALYMRPTKDYRSDSIVKKELLAQAIADGFEPWLFLDDRNSVVKMWRDEGYTCLQVAEGNF